MTHARNRHLQRFACLLLLLGVTGCAGWDDPFQREGTWRPEYNNDANLRTTVADPNDLVQGVGDDESPGALSAAAVRRLLTDHVKPLPSASSTNVGPAQSADHSYGGAATP